MAIAPVMTDEQVSAFLEWLGVELHVRGMSKREFARLGGISDALVVQWFSGTTRPGIRALQATSAAFGLSLLEVQQRAGLLPEAEVLAQASELALRIDNLPEAEQARLLATIEDLLVAARLRSQVQSRPGELPATE